MFFHSINITENLKEFFSTIKILFDTTSVEWFYSLLSANKVTKYNFFSLLDYKIEILLFVSLCGLLVLAAMKKDISALVKFSKLTVLAAALVEFAAIKLGNVVGFTAFADSYKINIYTQSVKVFMLLVAILFINMFFMQEAQQYSTIPFNNNGPAFDKIQNPPDHIVKITGITGATKKGLSNARIVRRPQQTNVFKAPKRFMSGKAGEAIKRITDTLLNGSHLFVAGGAVKNPPLSPHVAPMPAPRPMSEQVLAIARGAGVSPARTVLPKDVIMTGGEHPAPPAMTKRTMGLIPDGQARRPSGVVASSSLEPIPLATKAKTHYHPGWEFNKTKGSSSADQAVSSVVGPDQPISHGKSMSREGASLSEPGPGIEVLARQMAEEARAIADIESGKRAALDLAGVRGRSRRSSSSASESTTVTDSSGIPVLSDTPGADISHISQDAVDLAMALGRLSAHERARCFRKGELIPEARGKLIDAQRRLRSEESQAQPQKQASSNSSVSSQESGEMVFSDRPDGGLADRVARQAYRDSVLRDGSESQKIFVRQEQHEEDIATKFAYFLKSLPRKEREALIHKEHSIFPLEKKEAILAEYSNTQPVPAHSLGAGGSSPSSDLHTVTPAPVAVPVPHSACSSDPEAYAADVVRQAVRDLGSSPSQVILVNKATQLSSASSSAPEGSEHERDHSSGVMASASSTPPGGPVAGAGGGTSGVGAGAGGSSSSVRFSSELANDILSIWCTNFESFLYAAHCSPFRPWQGYFLLYTYIWYNNRKHNHFSIYSPLKNELLFNLSNGFHPESMAMKALFYMKPSGATENQNETQGDKKQKADHPVKAASVAQPGSKNKEEKLSNSQNGNELQGFVWEKALHGLDLSKITKDNATQFALKLIKHADPDNTIIYIRLDSKKEIEDFVKQYTPDWVVWKPTEEQLREQELERMFRPPNNNPVSYKSDESGLRVFVGGKCFWQPRGVAYIFYEMPVTGPKTTKNNAGASWSIQLRVLFIVVALIVLYVSLVIAITAIVQSVRALWR